MPPRHERSEMATLMAASPQEQASLLRAWGLPELSLLMLQSPCQGFCSFCANSGVRETPLSPSQRALDFAAQVDGGLLCVGGNEPSTHPVFERALELARADSVQVMSSGLCLVECAARWAELGVRSVAVPIYSARAAVHECITGMDHAQLVEGLIKARDAGIEVYLHSLALRANMNDLGDLAEWCQLSFGRRLVVAPARAKDDVFDYLEAAPSLDEVRGSLAELDVELLGWPDCVLPEHPRGGAEVIRVYFHGQARAHGRVCAGCSLREGCAGVVEGELRHRGEAGLQPPSSEAMRP